MCHYQLMGPNKFNEHDTWLERTTQRQCAKSVQQVTPRLIAAPLDHWAVQPHDVVVSVLDAVVHPTLESGDMQKLHRRPRSYTYNL